MPGSRRTGPGKEQYPCRTYNINTGRCYCPSASPFPGKGLRACPDTTCGPDPGAAAVHSVVVVQQNMQERGHTFIDFHAAAMHHCRINPTTRESPRNPGTAVLNAESRKSVRILVVDDEHTLLESCASVLRMEGFEVTASARGQEALTLVRRGVFDILLLDLNMSQVSGLELLAAGLEVKPDTLAIVMTGDPSVASSVEALRAGAWDYLPKPFAAGHLQILIGRAAHTVLAARETEQQDEALLQRHSHSDKVALLGSSPAFQRVIDLSRRVAATDASVFITGESGTGKEQIAQFIHHHSRRHSRQLVAVNCAALPEALLETEMFGHVQGAFTGAVRDKAGLLEAANGGTLFLDEITEMPPALQAKLLRVIQDGVVRRLGSTTTDAVVNVRFIAATNRDPQRTAMEDVLRSDLFYRLCVVPIHIPPLRERPTDIPLLAQHFLSRYWSQHREPGSAVPRFSPQSLEALQARHWPGNVRELQNVIEHSVVLLEPGCEIQPDDLPHLSSSTATPSAQPLEQPTFDGLTDESYHGVREKVLQQFEQGYLKWLIGRAGGNMSRAARIAGVDRTTLYRLMEKHGLQRDTVITAR
ncbi:MAG: sigma-54-dependent Fis family transcriptional regulator [Gemmatimonadetes bacterium]|nr:sigma-54-dependent Fis family transcriptional regulator [Gemmatimonadota bacterium]